MNATAAGTDSTNTMSTPATSMNVTAVGTNTASTNTMSTNTITASPINNDNITNPEVSRPAPEGYNSIADRVKVSARQSKKRQCSPYVESDEDPLPFREGFSNEEDSNQEEANSQDTGEQAKKRGDKLKINWMPASAHQDLSEEEPNHNTPRPTKMHKTKLDIPLMRAGDDDVDNIEQEILSQICIVGAMGTNVVGEFHDRQLHIVSQLKDYELYIHLSKQNGRLEANFDPYVQSAVRKLYY